MPMLGKYKSLLPPGVYISLVRQEQIRKLPKNNGLQQLHYFYAVRRDILWL